jgi:hypothetical protein
MSTISERGVEFDAFSKYYSSLEDFIAVFRINLSYGCFLDSFGFNIFEIFEL